MSHRWLKPASGILKCNVHCSWVNDHAFCGGAWIIRNHFGDVLFHARDAFLPRSNRITAELSCILWCLQSLKDLHVLSCEIWTDCSAGVAVLESPRAWPKYHSLVDKIFDVRRTMGEISFKLSAVTANLVARDIAKSVTKDGRLTSYLALGGPAWLQERIVQEQ
ncbi:putative protein phosphatase 2C-like protein 45 [Capsella rubella]|nr:putative protein phosphatase 2C-like protein 45 [Capsella rubella]